MELLVLKDELAELESRLEAWLKRVVAHELLPLVRVVDLLENVDPELLLPLRQSGWGHDRAHDEVVVDRDPLRRARGKARVYGGRRARGGESAKRPKLLGAGLVQREALARIVHRCDDPPLMTGDRRRDGRTRGLAQIREGLGLHGVLDATEESLVLLLRTVAGDGERVLRRLGDEVLRGLPRAVVVHPQEEGVER